MEINVRMAEEHEKLDISSADKQMFPFHDDWENNIFMNLREGDYVVEINDPDGILKWAYPGKYQIHMDKDGGYRKRIPMWDDHFTAGLGDSSKV